MSQFLSSMVAPNVDGTVLACVPLVVLTPDEAEAMAEDFKRCAEQARRAKHNSQHRVLEKRDALMENM